MTRRRLSIGVAAAATGAVGLVLLAHPPAGAVDVWGNVGPASQLPPGALADAYPLGNYALDHHFNAVEAGVFSGVDVSGIAPTVAWLLANLIWQLTALLANAVITLFTFAFSLDLVNGSKATGGAGALGPVSDAVRSIYRDVFGEPWLTVAVLLAGMWSMWQALVRRRYTETAGALALSLLYIVIALAFVTQPERTIGQASRWTNEISTAFLSLTADGQVGEAQRAKQDASDHLFELLVYRPWVVLQFGGTEHCVRNAGSDDPTDVPVRPLSTDPDRDARLARQLARSQQVEADDGKVCVNNRLKYAPHFLRFEPGSDQRNAQYEALKDGDSGKLPDEDPGKGDGTYRLGPIDKPAAEAMGKSAQYQRLGIAVVIFAGELGVYLLLGALAVSVIVAQVLVLLLLAFAPVALVIGTFPGRGHQFFLDWLARLASFLLRKALYSLILAILLAVSAALQAATSNLGWLMAFGLQAVFFWAVFLNRKQLTGQLSTTLTGTTGHRDEARLLAGVGAAYVTRRALRRAVGRIAKATGPTGRDGHRAPPRPSHAPTAPREASALPPLAPAASDTTDTPGDQTAGDAPARGADRAPGDHAAATERSPRRDAEPDPGPARVERHDSGADAAGPGRDRSAGRPAASDPTTGSSSRSVPSSLQGEPRRSTGPAHADPVDPPRAARRAASDPNEQAAARAGTARPASRDLASTTPESARPEARRPASENALIASLRADARRLHRDAARVHRDAQQLADAAAPDPRPHTLPAPPPRPRTTRTRGSQR